MKRTRILTIILVFCSLMMRIMADESAVVGTDIGDIYFTNLEKQQAPKSLLVLILNYNNGYYDMNSQDTEAIWADYIFGSGAFEKGEATINDYLREISQGQFYYEPIKLGKNKTGVYSFTFDKDYSDAQGVREDWPFQDMRYDVMVALDSLIDQGLDINRFSAIGIDNDNFIQIMIDYFDASQERRNPQWYTTDSILCIFPEYNSPHVDLISLSTSIDVFGLYTHVNFESSFGTIAHELAHTLGAVDVYNFGDYGNDLMSTAIYEMPEPYQVAHLNPYYKTVFGWAKPQVLLKSGKVTIDPVLAGEFKPLIVKTDDKNQYFIIENRKAEKFDSGLADCGYEGINIWRIDKLGLEAIYNCPRKGISLSAVLSQPGDSIKLNYYSDKTDQNNEEEVDSGVSIRLEAIDPKGSIIIAIDNSGVGIGSDGKDFSKILKFLIKHSTILAGVGGLLLGGLVVFWLTVKRRDNANRKRSVCAVNTFHS